MPRFNKLEDSVKKIGIRFGDNDFGNTFTTLLLSLFEAYKHTGYLPKDKNKLCFIINQLSPVMYLIGQNCYEYNGLEEVTNGLKTNDSIEYQRIGLWLQILPAKIYIDKEVDEFIEEHGDFNSEFFVLDLTLHNNNVYIF